MVTREVTCVMLVDDHAVFRDMLALVFDREPGFEVVAQAGTVAEARAVLQELEKNVDVALVDIDMPDGQGTELLGDLRAKNPDGVALILTASEDREVHARAVERGAAGVLHKSVGLKEVTKSVRRVVAGETLLSPDDVLEMLRIADRQREENREAQRAIEQLTPREREVLQSLTEGLSDKEIAERLYVGSGTVRTHVVSILSKLGVHSRLQALVFAVRHGVVEID